jgi:hypothetical protein
MGTALQDQLISGIQANAFPEVKAAINDSKADVELLGASAVGAIARKVMQEKGFYPKPLPELPANASAAQLVENQALLAQSAADDKAASEAELKDARAAAAVKARWEKVAQTVAATIAGTALVAGRKTLESALAKI